jgi:hypothetical protein
MEDSAVREEPELKMRWPRIEAKGKEAIAAVRRPVQFLLYSRAVTGVVIACVLVGAFLFGKAEALDLIARWCWRC